MTLIVGLKCSDGIVMGADGAATYGALGQVTIRQPTKKLCIIDGCAVLGLSGPIGLGQRLADELGRLRSAKELSGASPDQAMTILRTKFWNLIGPEIQAAAHAKNLVGGAASAGAVSQTLVAMPVAKEACLFQFDQQGAPEAATDELPFVAIGSGQMLADPFLAFVRRIFWPNRAPSLGEGLFAVLWCLKHAILTNAGGVADPKQIVVLEEAKGGLRAREVEDAELRELEEAVLAAESSLARFGMERTEVGEIVSPPQAAAVTKGE